MKKIYTLLLTIAILNSSCNTVSESTAQELKHYDLSHPEEFNMPESLFEISGIAFKHQSNDTIYAIQDEEGKLFRLPWKVKVQQHVKFGKKGDYEDVTILKDQVYILKSNGHIFSIPVAEAVGEEVENVREFESILPKGEYESMFGDEKSGQLYVLCKNCEVDKSTKHVTGYILDPASSLAIASTFRVSTDEISKFTEKPVKTFRPSGLAFNPHTGECFIISAVNKLLVVTDKNWKVTGAYHLGGEDFTQPEGIAFDNMGNLYISNEGDDLSEGNILRFARKN